MLHAMIAALLALAPPSNPACPVPTLAAPSGGDAFARRFAASTPAFRSLSSNLLAAFRRACAKGLITREGLLGVGSGGGVAVAIENAPEANVASVRAERLPNGARGLILENPFIASDGSIDVPTEDEIEEAIFCAVRGASPGEQEESGRCLPD